MTRERWLISGEVLTPEVLSSDPDKYGGLGLHMLASIKAGVVTIPLTNNGSHVSIPVSRVVADKVISEGGIEIESNHWWSSVLSDKIKLFFIGSDKEVPLYKVGLHSLSS